MDRKLFIFLVKSHCKIDLLLLNGAISVKSEVPINLHPIYGDFCMTPAATPGPALLLHGAEVCTPAVEGPSVLNVLFGCSQLIHDTLTERLMESGSKMAETYMQASYAKQSIS